MPDEPKPALPPDTPPAYRWWLIRYPDRSPQAVACFPEATRADIIEAHPDAVAAEPFTPATRKPTGPMTAKEHASILGWLALIGERDKAAIAQVFDLCQRDADARDYFLGQAAELLETGRKG